MYTVLFTGLYGLVKLMSN